ncbi:MAG: glycosyltransferase [Bacilli bacterium]|nr:glycosyltransferase [Clostridia bacterium]MBR3490266.1 glycosyltransferase [Bacilli bacterium]
MKKLLGKLKSAVYVIAILMTVAYIVYRIGFTLPINLGITGMIFALIVLGLEIWESLDFFIYYLNILSVDQKSPAIPIVNDSTLYPDVDVFIATINENEALLRNTIEACKNMEYPDKSKVHIYICDDGNREGIARLADSMGIGYITRLNNKNAKAGNYNHALKKTSSPLIATFDADMCPTPNFLMTTVPFFIVKDKVGFVQLPQSFNNPDIYQLRFGMSDKLPFEQEYFYHRIQIAKNATNSTVYCGTNAVISREALDATDGFALSTISEDIATGMLIEEQGYKGIALDNVEAYGESVNDLTAFAKQRSRWARGCVQIFKKYKISNRKGLNFRQKLEYLSCISYWFFGIKRMIYLIAPLLFSLFGLIIVDCDLKMFLAFWVPTYLVKRFALDALEGRRRSSTWTKIYETVLTPVMCKEVFKELIGLGSTKFEVTPKTKWSKKMTKTNKFLLSVHLTFLALSIAAVVMSGMKAFNEGIIVYVLPLIWLISNIFYLTISVLFDLRVKPVYYEKFVPNKIKKYNKFSIISLLGTIGKKKFK